MNIFNRLHHVCIVVRDIDKARAFYKLSALARGGNIRRLSSMSTCRFRTGALLEDALSGLQHLQPAAATLPTAGGRLPAAAIPEREGRGRIPPRVRGPSRCDAGEAEGVAGGLNVRMRGRRGDGSGFAYFDTADQAGVILENSGDAAVGDLIAARLHGVRFGGVPIRPVNPTTPHPALCLVRSGRRAPCAALDR